MGNRFTPNSTATLHFQKPDGTEYSTLTVPIKADGSFSIPYTAPSDKPVGNYTWWAIDDTSGGKSNEVIYTITEGDVPTIAQSPMQATPGTTFTQWGTGFTPNGRATLHFQKSDGSEYPTQTVSVNSKGSFEISYKSSLDKAPGTYTWWAVDNSTGESCIALKYEILKGDSDELAGFAFSQINDQKVNTLFQIEITARDGQGNIYTGFNGEVSLSAVWE